MYHSHYVHCGFELLPMSKQIMNKVFSCASGLDVETYYHDTGSTHLNYDAADEIVKRYKQKQNQELVGDGLGNPHVGFNMDGAATEIYGVRNLFLGKETYISILEPTDKDCNTINSQHLRYRRIPTSCIKYKASQDMISVLDICKDPYKGEVIEFDLIKFVCKKNTRNTASNVYKFARKIHLLEASKIKPLLTNRMLKDTYGGNFGPAYETYKQSA